MNYFPDEVTIGLIEIPDEISVIIPVAGCGFHCEDCHSPHYQDINNGEELTIDSYLSILNKYKDKASCICFFSGEDQVGFLDYLEIAKREGFKTALYTGRETIGAHFLPHLDYFKVGPYVEALGGLDSPTTNQRFMNNKLEDLTYKFWRHND